MKSPRVVNLYGGPGTGKSTGAAQIFSELKKRGFNVELVTEFAKDKTWENNSKALECQEYVFGKQSYRLYRCRDKVDIIVTDSPLLLSILYNKNPALDDNFKRLVRNVYKTYENLNFFLIRVKPYNPVGRNQTEDESKEIDKEIRHLLNSLNIDYNVFDGDQRGYMKIVDKVVRFISDR